MTIQKIRMSIIQFGFFEELFLFNAIITLCYLYLILYIFNIILQQMTLKRVEKNSKPMRFQKN